MINELLMTTLVMSSTSSARSMNSFLFMFININEVFIWLLTISIKNYYKRFLELIFLTYIGEEIKHISF